MNSTIPVIEIDRLVRRFGRADAVNGLSHAQIQELLKPFDDRIVEPRKSDGQKVVPHDYVRGRLSEIFGPLGWSEQQLELTQVATGADGIADARYVDSDSVMRYIAYRARVRLIIHNPDGSTRTFWDGAGAWGQGRTVRDNDQRAIWDLHSDAMNGALFQGRPLTVNEAKPREERPRTGGERPRSFERSR